MADTGTAAGQTPAPRKKPVLHTATDETRRRVRSLSAAGVTAEDIARVLDISRRSFFRHYKKEMELGLVEALGYVTQRLYVVAMGGARTAADRNSVRAAIHLQNKFEHKLLARYGVDVGGVGVAEQMQATRPSIIKPDEPIPETPVL